MDNWLNFRAPDESAPIFGNWTWSHESVERMPLDDGFAWVLERAVPVDAVGVAGDVLSQGYVTAVDVDRGRLGRRRRVAETGQDDQDDSVLPPVHTDI